MQLTKNKSADDRGMTNETLPFSHREKERTPLAAPLVFLVVNFTNFHVSCHAKGIKLLLWQHICHLFIKSLNGCFVSPSDEDPYITEIANDKFFIASSLF